MTRSDLANFDPDTPLGKLRWARGDAKERPAAHERRGDACVH